MSAESLIAALRRRVKQFVPKRRKSRRCAVCREKHFRQRQGYCADCHAAYQRRWRADRRAKIAAAKNRVIDETITVASSPMLTDGAPGSVTHTKRPAFSPDSGDRPESC